MNNAPIALRQGGATISLNKGSTAKRLTLHMALRTPKSLAKIVKPETGLSMVEAEMLAETAASLGHHGRKVEKAMKRLDEGDYDDRDEMIQTAAREVWAYFIQRELMGMRDHKPIIKEMNIPAEVLNMMGAVMVRK